MSRTPSTTGRNPSDNLRCPYCQTVLPPKALFCSSCGKQVNKKKSREGEGHTESAGYDAQEQDETIRFTSLSKEHLKRWQSSRSLKNTVAPQQSHIISTPPQDLEVAISSPVETEIPETEPGDAQALRETLTPGKLPQSLPTTPVPEAWQPIPVTEVPVAQPPGSNRLWPVIIILSAVAAGLVNFVFTDLAIRPIIVFWFLAVCPGMVLVRFLRLKEPAVEWLLASALSFAIDALVAAILLYTGKWSPATILSILIGFCLGGAIVQAVLIPQPRARRARKRRALWHLASKHKVKKSATITTSKQWLSPSIWHPGIVLIFLALLIGSGVATGFWSDLPRHSAASQSTVTSHSSRPSSIRVSTISPLTAGTYSGTIYDLSSNTRTNLSLTVVRQNQGKISGYLIQGSRLQGSDPFSGTIDTAKHLHFTMIDAARHTTFFFEGAMQTATSLGGDYYQCNPNSTQNSQCSRIPGGYGIWYVVLVT